MMRFLTVTLTLLLLVSCSATRHGKTVRQVTDPTEMERIALLEKPDLAAYLKEGVLDLKSVTEAIDSKGVVRHKIKYGFKKNHITDEDSVEAILKEYFPEIYRAREAGSVHVDGIYKSVNARGRIQYKVDYDLHSHHDDCD